MRKLLKILLILTILYSAVLLLFYVIQEAILFQPEKLSQDYSFNFEYNFEEFFIEAEDGVKLNGLHFKTQNPKGAILYFHGNRGSLKRWGEIATFFVQKEYNVVIMDYRSYGKSGGEITEDGLYHDAQLFYEYTLGEYPKDQITVYGRSLGTGLAIKTAAINNPARLILETPYYSIKDVADNWFPWLPTGLLLRYEIPSYQFIQNVNCPVTIFHGTQDQVVPYTSGKKLFESIPVSKKKLVTIPGGRHNNLVHFKEYQEIIDLSLEEK